MNIPDSDVLHVVPEPLKVPVTESWRDLSPELQAITLRFYQLQSDGKPHPVEAGKMLMQAKNLLGHGNFLGWLAEHFHLSAKSANRLMSVAQLFQQLNADADTEQLLLQLDNSALYELAAKSTPNDIQHYVLSLLRAGELVSYSDIRQLKGQPRIRQVRDLEVRQRFLGLLNAFKSWYDANQGELTNSLSRLDEQGRKELEHYAPCLADACALIDTILSTNVPNSVEPE